MRPGPVMLPAMSFSDLFPGAVVAVSTETDRLTGALYPQEAEHIRHAIAKRRDEFTLGRLCAREALGRAGIQDFPLRVGPNREPRWPPGITGSITHCDGFCGVALARAPIRAIGIDAETRAPLPAEIFDLVFLPDEKRQLAMHRLPEAAKLIFSAKESIYKCQFPLAALPLDFADVEIKLDEQAGGFSAKINASMPVPPGLRIIHGRFAMSPSHVYTAVVLSSHTEGS